MLYLYMKTKIHYAYTLKGLIVLVFGINVQGVLYLEDLMIPSARFCNLNTIPLSLNAAPPKT